MVTTDKHQDLERAMASGWRVPDHVDKLNRTQQQWVETKIVDLQFYQRLEMWLYELYTHEDTVNPFLKGYMGTEKGFYATEVANAPIQVRLLELCKVRRVDSNNICSCMTESSITTITSHFMHG